MRLVERLAISEKSPSKRLSEKELQNKALNALQQLDDNSRNILTLRFLEQLSLAEISEITGCKIDTLSQHSARYWKASGSFAIGDSSKQPVANYHDTKGQT